MINTIPKEFYSQRFMKFSWCVYYFLPEGNRKDNISYKIYAQQNPSTEGNGQSVQERIEDIKSEQRECWIYLKETLFKNVKSRDTRRKI